MDTDKLQIGAHVAVLLAVLILMETGLPIWGFWHMPARGFLDFDQGYYPGAQAIVHNPAELYRVRANAPANFVNLPLVAWLFVPFTVLPLQEAGRLLLFLNIIISAICLWLIQRRVTCGPALRWAITAIFVTSGPLLNGINLGQTTPLVLLMLLLAERSFHKNNEIHAGIWLGICALIKVPLLLLIPYLAVRKYWRAFSAAAALVFILAGISIVCYGWDLHATYFDLVFRANMGTAIAAHNSQSIDSFLARIATHASLWSWRSIPLSPGLIAAKWLILAGMLMALLRVFLNQRNLLSEACAVLCMSLLISPIYWIHYGAWLIPVLVVVGSRMGLHPTLMVCTLLINFPAPSPAIIQHYDANPWFRIAISHQFFGTLLLFGLCISLSASSPRRKLG